jgi:hypothetical protein
MEPHGAPPWWIVLWPLVLPAVLFGVLQGWEWWLNRRAQRDWDRGEAERQRRWAEEDRR